MIGETKSQANGSRTAIFLLVTGLLVLMTYVNTLNNAPTNWDDPRLFSNPYFHGLTLSNLKHALVFQRAATFQPVRDISYMIDFSLWKTPQHLMVGLHVHSILLYLIMMIFCFFFLKELFRSFELKAPQASFLAGVTTILYAVHPVHVESVAWLYARKEPLMGVFTFVCLWSFLKAHQAKQKGYYIISAGALILAILAKPTAIVLPVALLALEMCLRRQKKEPFSWAQGLWFFVPMAAFAIWQAARLISMMFSASGIMSFHGGSFWTNLLAVSQIFMAYIKLIGFTAHYAADYPIRLYISPAEWQAWLFVLLNVLLLGSALMAFVKRHFLYAFFVFWYYLFLGPVSNILPLSQTMADRYALLPSLSWCVLISAALTWLRFLTIPAVGGIRTPSFPRLLSWGLAGLIIAGYSAMTIRQNDVWQNSQTLWENTVALYPNSFPGNTNLSILYINQGRYREAEQLCLNVLSNLPYENLAGVGYLPLTNLAMAQMRLGEYANAIWNYQVILRFDPRMPQANLGIAHCYWQLRDYPMAYHYYQHIRQKIVITLPRTQADVLYRAGYSAWKMGRNEEALSLFDQACSLPDKAVALSRALTDAYIGMGRPDKAAECSHGTPVRAKQS